MPIWTESTGLSCCENNLTVQEPESKQELFIFIKKSRFFYENFKFILRQQSNIFYSQVIDLLINDYVNYVLINYLLMLYNGMSRNHADKLF